MSLAVYYDLPSPVKLVGYSPSSLSVNWSSYSDEQSYIVYYTANSVWMNIKTPNNSLQITCSQFEIVSIYYQPLASLVLSSPVSSFACVSPAQFTIQVTRNLWNVSVYWTSFIVSSSNCYIFDLVNAVQIGNVPYSFGYLQIVSGSGTFALSCSDFNSYYNQTFSLSPIEFPDFSTFSVKYPVQGLTLTQYLVSMTTNLNIPVLALLEVTDVCSIVNGYECVRVLSTDPNWNTDLLLSYQYISMSGTGVLNASYYPPLIGKYSMSVIVLQSGVLGHYWDNIWFDGGFDTKTHNNINFTWTSIISNYASEFVSAKFHTFLMPKYSENHTFYLEADDNARMYLNGNLIIDMWNVCCQMSYAVAFLNSSLYYYIKIEYRQIYSNARLILSWSSRSLSKEVIPSDRLYLPTRVQSWVQTVDLGKSNWNLCYFTVSKTVKAGDLNTMSFYSVDYNGNLIDNPSDVYTVNFSQNYQLASSYLGSKTYKMNFTLTTAKVFTVYVMLYGNNILGSPFLLTVAGGDLGALYSYTNASEGKYSVGKLMNFTVFPYDAFNNLLSSFDRISASLYLVSPVLSNLKVSPPVGWFSIYNKTVVTFSYPLVLFKCYIAGSYSLSLYSAGQLFAGYPITIPVSAGDFLPEHSVVTYNSTSVIAGSQFTSVIQARDSFYNNITSDFALPPYSYTSKTSTGSLSVLNGQIIAKIILTSAGANYLSLTINGSSVPMPVVDVEANAILSFSYSTLTIPSSSYLAGQTVQAVITSKDSFGNIRYNLNDSYAITVDSASFDIQDNMDGTYFIIFSPLLVGKYIINVYANSINIQGSPAVIFVTPSGVRGLLSDLIVTANTAGQLMLNISSKDIGGNLVANPVKNPLMGLQYYFVSVIGPTNLTKNASYSDYTCFNVNLTSVTRSGNYSIVLSLFEEQGLNAFYYKDNNFSVLVELNSFNNYPGLEPSMYTQKDPQVLFDWTQSNPIINSTVLSNLFSVLWSGNILISFTELYTFFISTDCRVSLIIAGSILIDTISLKTTKNLISSSIFLTANTFFAFQLKYQNCGSRGYLGLYYSSPSESYKAVPSSVLFAQVNSKNSPYFITVLPDKTSASNSVLTSDSGLLVARAGVLKTYMISAYDKYGNQQLKNDFFFAQMADFSVVFFTGTGGNYEVQVSLNRIGQQSLKFYLQWSSGAEELACDITVQVGPGAGYGNTSSISTMGNLTAGEWGSFALQTNDQFGNQVNIGGDSIDFSVCDANKTSSVCLPSSQILITDLNTGQYKLNFMSYNSSFFNLSVSVNKLFCASQVIFIYPASASPLESQMVLPQSVHLNASLNLTVFLKDIYYNLVNTTQTVISTVFMPNVSYFRQQNLVLIPITPYEYRSSLNLSNICKNCSGGLNATAWIIDPGLVRLLYNNSNFLGQPLKQIDYAIDFNFSSNSSVVWQGVIFGKSGGISLSISGNDYAFVYINGTEVMTLPNKTNAFLGTDSYFFIQIMFNCTNAGRFRLSFSESQTIGLSGQTLGNWRDSQMIGGGSVSTLIN